ncbi:MAG TPA: hypothetical protein VLG69_05070 [Candidatus Andersenbacteria bacterium]|nr:hypothetical protein [Candidatus Andersenbacteria bacterium]
MIKSFIQIKNWQDLLLLFVACACLLATAIQYPLSTTFPIGGDAAAIIQRVQHTTTDPIQTIKNISHTWYPVSYLLFSINSLIPHVYWPIAFSWWMAIGQLFTGIALGILLYRLGGMQASALAIALWAITPIIMTSFFEDGTMAQLWSLPWIIFFLERMAAKSFKGMAIFALLSVFSHPITGFVLIATLIITAMISDKRIFLLAILASIIPVIILYIRQSILYIPFTRESSSHIFELLHGFYFPWLLAAIYGWYSFLQKYKKNNLLIIGFGSFLFVSFLLGLNDYIGIGFWTHRVDIYLVLFVIIMGSIGFSGLLKNLLNPTFAAIFSCVLIIGLTLSIFHDNENIYKRYESPSTYSRIHPQELLAIDWMNKNLPVDTTVFTSAETRNYEWIPVLTPLKWILVSNTPYLFHNQISNAQNPVIIFFTRKDNVPDSVRNDSEHYNLLYENPSVKIYSIASL